MNRNRPARRGQPAARSRPGERPPTPQTAAERPLVSVVVVSYGTRALTLRALRLLHDSPTAVPYEVIVVDNASADGSAAAVRAAFPQARMIELANNVGFGRAVNVAAGDRTGRMAAAAQSGHRTGR